MSEYVQYLVRMHNKDKSKCKIKIPAVQYNRPRYSLMGEINDQINLSRFCLGNV